MHLFYTPDIKDSIYKLKDEEAKHCVRVLRLKIDDIIWLTDGCGSLYKAKIIDNSLSNCLVEIVELIGQYGKRPCEIHLAVAPTKNLDRFEWFLEKATEIGVDRIIPVFTEHSERKVVKSERLEKVILSAVKQSIKAYVPVLEEGCRFKDFLKTVYYSEFQKFIAYCPDTEDLPRVLLKNVYQPGRSAVVLIGPEGDFTSAEVQMAVDCGFVPVSLGNSRLRTETAAIVACHTLVLANE